MIRRSPRFATWPTLLAACALALLVRGAAAQTPLSGQVVDSAGKPVAGQHVTLHEVTPASGAMVDSAVTDARGRFTVRVPAVQDTGTIFFVATRWQGDLYIGTPFRPPLPSGANYTVTVGVNPVNMGPAGGGGMGGGSAATGPAAAPPSSSGATRWFLVAMLALVALGAVAYALIGGARERAEQRRRAILLRIAELDERAAGAGDEESSALRRERAELMTQLTRD